METIKSKGAWKNSPTLKIFIIGFIVLIMLIPTAMLVSLNSERVSYHNKVTNEISQTFGGYQNIFGPVISVPYKYQYREKLYKQNEYVIKTETRYAHFLPKNLDIESDITTEMRYRSIYEVPVYKTNTKIKGYFSEIDFKDLNVNPNDIQWDQALLFFTITNPSAINDQVSFNLNGKEIKFNPATKLKKSFGLGLEAIIPNPNLNHNDQNINFSIDMSFNGSEALELTPLAEENSVKFKSNWEHPSFTGSQLPSKREINQQGFFSQWKTLHFGRTYPQKWLHNTFTKAELIDNRFGVDFYVPVDIYQLTERAIKYSELFIILTFISFFLFEILLKIKVHPIQYIMIGVSLCIFYVLLLSLSEHISFTLSYILASLSTLIMITSFSMAILQNKKRGSIIGAILFTLYSYLFVTLQLESYSLLMGAIGLFITMAIIMWVTRKVDWYSFSQTISEKGQNLINPNS